MAARTAAEVVDAAGATEVARRLGVSSPAVPAAMIETFPCVLTNMTTEDLARVRLGAGGACAVVKVARSPRHSPLWETIPEAFREEVMRELPWRAEVEVYASPLRDLLPAGLRMPALYAVDELGDDRVALWLEHVEQRHQSWSIADYAAAARALGRLAGRLPEHRMPPGVPTTPRDLRPYFFGRVTVGTLPLLREDATWTHPLISAAADPTLRADLDTLAARAPALLDRLAALPRTFVHGDACPQNLIRPVTDLDVVVAIDWGLCGVAPLGMDGGQLVAGRAESGELDPDDLAGVLDVVTAAYADGLAEEGAPADPALVRLGVAGNLVIRSAFTAVPTELLGQAPTPDLTRLVAQRVRYARSLVDLGLQLQAESPA